MIALRVSAEHDALTPPGKPQDRLDFYYYSGIYRDVNMIVSDKLHITDELEADKVAGGGLFVTYPKVSKEEAVSDDNGSCTVTWIFPLSEMLVHTGGL